MLIWSRKRVETIILAALAIATVVPLRLFVESRFWFVSEIGFLAVMFLAVAILKSREGINHRTPRFAKPLSLILGTTPVYFAIAARAFGSPIPFEMSALTTFGSISLAMASVATTNRTRALSLIASGFLVLFCASISEGTLAPVLPLVWMLGCVWHLIANHWERLDLAMPESVERTWSVRPSVLVVALVVLCVGGYAAKDRLASNRLTMNLMPTSGGSQWSDPAARSGVGSGDAAIAAKDHAESFGAVDSDIFLESTESTLFDMFNDLIGEPKKQKMKWERRQGMANENVIPMHERAAKTEQGGGATFSTERLPPKKHHHFKDANDHSVVQWDGPTGIRLAMQRYDTFKHGDWSQAADRGKDRLSRVDIDSAIWFLDPDMRKELSADPDLVSVGLLKVIRLGSPRIPVPMMTAGIHIKKVDRQDFFGLADDGSFFMPDRDKVPPLTVVHVASRSLLEDEILESLSAVNPPVANTDPASKKTSAVSAKIQALVDQWTTGSDQPYDKIQAINKHLRTDFVLDRDSERAATSLSEFLDSRRGGDHLFATTAALMARQLGLTSRLVTGFYVRPDSFDITAGHSCVLPRDAHAWTEIRLNSGHWFEVDPTPGYVAPVYRPSWRLMARRFVAAYWQAFAFAIGMVALGWISRRYWVDWLLTAAWRLAGWLRPRQRIRLAIRIIETRARFAGVRRPPGESQRAWLEQLTHTDANISVAAKRFSDFADIVFFGAGAESNLVAATTLVDLLPIKTINALSKTEPPKTEPPRTPVYKEATS